MKLLVRVADDDGVLMGKKLETAIEPIRVEDRGLETVYTFMVEYHKFNEEKFLKYLSEQQEADNV